MIKRPCGYELLLPSAARETKCSQGRRPFRRQHSINEHLQHIKQNIKEELQTERLLYILEEFQKYPEKYRTIIWMAIVKLPCNIKAYNSLSSSIRNRNLALILIKDYCLADKGTTSLLVTILECLIEWCPFLAQVKFIPRLVFPFAVVYRKNPLLAFELIINIILNYCLQWFEYYPLPPLNILSIIENILLEVDPSLANIFCEHNITSLDYAWPLMQSVMSEVLSATEWLILWDHLISYQQPYFLLMCIVAYNVCAKDTIISMLSSKKNLKDFYTKQGCITAKHLLKVTVSLDLEIPLHVHPRYYCRNTCLALPPTGPYPSLILHNHSNSCTKNACLSQLKRTMEQRQMWQESSVTQKSAGTVRRKQCNKSRLKLMKDNLLHTQKEESVNYKNLQHNVEKLVTEIEQVIKLLRCKQ